MANNTNDRIKVAGYARRIFFNDNIEYRNFSPDLVGLQFTSDGGTALFTNGNFTISTNLDPKPNVVFTQGTKSQLYTLEDVAPNSGDIQILGNLKTELNLDLSNPLTYIWYGSASELIRASLEDIQDQWPAAIYVDNKVGSVIGNNITNYVYDVVQDQSTFTINSRYFVNPYNIKYTEQEGITGTETPTNPLRNFTTQHTYYTIEHNGIVKNIKSIIPTTQTTNSDMELVVDGNPFPELTGIILPQFSFLFTPIDASIPFFIKPNETQRELFFSKLNTLQRNLLNRETYPAYKSIIIGPQITDSGVIVIIKEILNFPILDDGYNLNFFDGFYISYLNTLNTIGENFDAAQTDLIVRKYTAEAISSFDTIPRGDGNNILLDGEKATKLLRIYGVGFDDVKKYMNGIKFAHTVTYDKKNNIPDALIKDLSFMLGLDPVTFVTDVNIGKTLLPSPIIGGEFSGTSTNYSAIGMDNELYRRLILNIAWIWKSKGTRKAIEFLFRFIGAPEALVNFNEYIVVVDEPLDMNKIKDLLYLYTGDVDTTNIPYDDDGFPLPPPNGTLVITDFISGPDSGTTGTTLTNSPIQEGIIQEMYFQKNGGWYRETFGNGAGVTILRGNNPHLGPYDGGNEYLNYFSKCYIPNFTGKTNIELFTTTTKSNAFFNYNYGIFNSVPDNTDIYTTEIVYNSATGGYQPISECLDVEYTILPTPLQENGKTTLQIAYEAAQQAFDNYSLLIAENSYLQYSSEWADIQSNLINAETAYGQEVSSQEHIPGHGLLNKTLEICITPTEEELGDPQGIVQCEEYEVVELDEFIYFTDNNGLKQNFTGIQDCCKKNEGEWFNFYDGYYDIGFCAIEDPCTGPPVDITGSGIVVFEMVGNVMPPNVITYDDHCYQYNEECFPESDRDDPCIECGEEAHCEHNLPDINTPAFWDWVNEIYGTSEFYQCFTEVNCTSQTIVSSPACCLYHGYAPTLQSIVYQGEVIEFYVCIDESSDSTPEDLSHSTLTYIIPELATDYTHLLPATNMNATVSQVSSIYQYSSVLPIVGYYNSVYTNPPSLYSYFNDPNLMTPSVWVLESVDQYGRLTFFAYDSEGNKVILDWTCPSDAGSALYQQVALLNGYTLGGPNGTTAIDSNFIPCENVDDVTIVFGAENYNGFKLPQVKDCSCAVNIEFDYMLKYDAANLISCAEVICFPAVFDNLSQFNINCINFIPFTTSEEESDLLLQNFDTDPNTNEYTIWTQEVTQVEPDVECCESFGGSLVEVENLNTTHDLGIKQIKDTYGQLIINGGLSSINNTNLNNLAFELNGIIGNIQNIVDSNCIDFTPYFPFTPPCPYGPYEEYITTQNICYLPVKEDCGLWTMMVQDYSNQLEWAYSVKADLENCINNPDIGTGGNEGGDGDDDGGDDPVAGTGTGTGTGDDTTTPPIVDPVGSGDGGYGGDTLGSADNFDDVTVVDAAAQHNQYLDDVTYTLEGNSVIEDINVLTKAIDAYTTKINDIQTQNKIIRNALTQTTTDLDCTTYSTQISELQSFNFLNYCKNNTVVSDILTYNVAINKCRDSKFKQVSAEIKKYQELLTLCESNNALNAQLIIATNQNQHENIVFYNNKIIENDNRINSITNSLYNEVIDSSPAQVADQQNVIKSVAQILQVSEKSITVNGNLSISPTYKISLIVKLKQNTHQITTIQRKTGSLAYELGRLRNTKTKLDAELRNNRKPPPNLGSKLLTIGGAIIGTALIAKGFLDPETAGGLMLGASGAAGPIKDGPTFHGCPDSGAQNYVSGSSGCLYDPYTGHYVQVLENGQCVMRSGCCFKACPPSGGGPSGGGGDEGEVGELGTVNDGGDLVFDPGGPVVTSCVFCFASPDDMAGQYFGPGNQPYQGQNTIFDGSGNFQPVTEACCTQAVVGVPVQWWIDFGGQGWCITTDLGSIPMQGSPELAAARANCVFGITGCMTPEATNYDIHSTIPCVDCCEFEVIDPGGASTGSENIIGCMDDTALNYDSTATISCGDCCLYEDLCCQTYLTQINLIINKIESFLPLVEQYRDQCYHIWNQDIHIQFNDYVTDTSDNYLNYIDDLQLNFKLFVDNSNSTGGNAIVSSLSYLPYCEQYNPFWEWSPNSHYSGIFITGTTADVAEVKSAIFNDLSTLSPPPTSMSTLFQPQWRTFNFQVDECVCDNLRKLYPLGQFYIGVEIENYECAVCLYIDNIKVDITDCEIDHTIVVNNCIIPQLSCVIDNKKSWVYTSAGITTETMYPNGPCNPESVDNYTVTKMLNPVNRYWDTLEYRYTDYDINHSDLIINTKSATFAIDPANAIECDVYNFWRGINCGECPTACETGGAVIFEGEIYYTGGTLSGYTLELSGATTGSLNFSCSTYTTLLEQQVLELKNDYYSLTADLNASLNASYYDLLALGGSISLFDIENNNCNTNNIILGNNKEVDNLFGIIVEEPDSTISFLETYVYSAATPYTGGESIEIFSGITAQTFNQTSGFTQECCETINKLLTDKGVTGLGIEKDYIWNSSVSACTWNAIDDCAGDCEYSGPLKVISREDCLSGITTGNTINVCVNPLDYLDVNPADIKTKDVFDEIVLHNLIDVKDRQVISNYPTLLMFYQLYLEANNCGKHLTGKLTYNSLFVFMDKIGEYWLDLIEQVVPATTIWEGCDNSGKLYRNTIFHQNKYPYRKYVLNFNDSNLCPVSGITNESIGEAAVDVLATELSLFPTTNAINNLITQSKVLKDLILNNNKAIEELLKRLCILDEQDPGPNVTNTIKQTNEQILNLETENSQLQGQLNNLLVDITTQQNELVTQQEVFQSQFTSCNAIASGITQAMQVLSDDFVPGTVEYERQVDFISRLRHEYRKCERENNLLISTYDTVFITQIYSSNEFEGTVTVTGDPEWEPGGPFYNSELIHNCV